MAELKRVVRDEYLVQDRHDRLGINGFRQRIVEFGNGAGMDNNVDLVHPSPLIGRDTKVTQGTVALYHNQTPFRNETLQEGR